MHTTEPDADLFRGWGGRRPEIVVLCGSTSFWPTFQSLRERLTLAGAIVLGPEVNAKTKPHLLGRHPEQTKHDLDEIHKRKIDLADRVFIVNVGGYVGDSTRSEIAYAIGRGVPIEYLEPSGQTSMAGER